jgi:hypothetical protein
VESTSTPSRTSRSANDLLLGVLCQQCCDSLVDSLSLLRDLMHAITVLSRRIDRVDNTVYQCNGWLPTHLQTFHVSCQLRYQPSLTNVNSHSSCYKT